MPEIASSQDERNYHSYLLRLWRDGEDAPWRASLDDTATGEQITFADVASLLLFIQTVAEESNAGRGT